MMAWIEHIQWRPEIGDPSVMGWLIVAAYGLGALMCASAARRVGTASRSAAADRMKWVVVSAVMTGLCLNKQLDLQSLLTDIGRAISRHQGWYEQRREVQKAVLLAVLAVSFGVAAAVVFWFRRFWARNLILLTGLGFLLTFIAVRAISFHHLDRFLGTQVVGVKLNWLLEVSGIALITAAAAHESWRPMNPIAAGVGKGRGPTGQPPCRRGR